MIPNLEMQKFFQQVSHMCYHWERTTRVCLKKILSINIHSTCFYIITKDSQSFYKMHCFIEIINNKNSVREEKILGNTSVFFNK